MPPLLSASPALTLTRSQADDARATRTTQRPGTSMGFVTRLINFPTSAILDAHPSPHLWPRLLKTSSLENQCLCALLTLPSLRMRGSVSKEAAHRRSGLDPDASRDRLFPKGFSCTVKERCSTLTLTPVIQNGPSHFGAPCLSPSATSLSWLPLTSAPLASTFVCSMTPSTATLTRPERGAHPLFWVQVWHDA
jgi:hypothetical protein